MNSLLEMEREEHRNPGALTDKLLLAFAPVAALPLSATDKLSAKAYPVYNYAWSRSA
jgi:hypothetical protein